MNKELSELKNKLRFMLDTLYPWVYIESHERGEYDGDAILDEADQHDE